MASNASDASMKVTELKYLKQEIDQELTHVENLLSEIADSCQTHPGEDDTIMKAIETTGNVLEENWRNLCSTFKQISSILSEIIEGYRKRIVEKVDDIGNMRKDL